MKSKLYYDLLGILEEQKALLGIKDELISKLVKDNREKEIESRRSKVRYRTIIEKRCC